eukprot:832887-Pelagomonas_calceolata.AAC.4
MLGATLAVSSRMVRVCLGTRAHDLHGTGRQGVRGWSRGTIVTQHAAFLFGRVLSSKSRVHTGIHHTGTRLAHQLSEAMLLHMRRDRRNAKAAANGSIKNATMT